MLIYDLPPSSVILLKCLGNIIKLRGLSVNNSLHAHPQNPALGFFTSASPPVLRPPALKIP